MDSILHSDLGLINTRKNIPKGAGRSKMKFVEIVLQKESQK
jgi:hypothetical protein